MKEFFQNRENFERVGKFLKHSMKNEFEILKNVEKSTSDLQNSIKHSIDGTTYNEQKTTKFDFCTRGETF